ncbi:MAG: hypothetical protein AB7S71_22545 [Dongiaceae bacterium]
MTASVIVLSTLATIGAGVLASTDGPATAAGARHDLAYEAPADAAGAFIQLADGGKGGDKYMSGKAGGRYGIAGGKDGKQGQQDKQGK